MHKDDCYYYLEYYDMGAHIPCCRKHVGLGNCPCDNCDGYLNKTDARVFVYHKRMTNGDVIKAMFPVEVWLQMKAREFNKTWWNAPYKAESEEVKGVHSIPIEPYKVNVNINDLPKMENDPIGEEIERQFKLRAAELKEDK